MIPDTGRGGKRVESLPGKMDTAENAPGTVTLVLEEVLRGTPGARDELFGLVYGELRRLARSYMRGERNGHTLQPTPREARLLKRFGTWIKSVKPSRLRAMEILLDDWLQSAKG